MLATPAELLRSGGGGMGRSDGGANYTVVSLT
jgi:hypothetical protein